jgi:hypothetical protein
MPFRLLTEFDPSAPLESLLVSGESVLHVQPLVSLWSGADVRHHAEGRGTLMLTSRRVMFLSDESAAHAQEAAAAGREVKSFALDYTDFSMHALSTSRIDWPHPFLLAKLSPPEEEAEQQQQQQQPQGGGDGASSAAPPSVWTRRSRRAAPPETDEDEDSDGQSSAAAVAPAASSPHSVSSASPAAAAAAAPPVPDEWEDRVVEELRFVVPKPAGQLRPLYDAWNRGDDLNTADEDEGDDDEHAHAGRFEDDAEDEKPDASTAAANARGAPSAASASAARASQQHAAMLRRLDGMLVVPPVVPNAVSAFHEAPPSPPNPYDDDDDEEQLDPFDPASYLPRGAAAASAAAAALESAEGGSGPERTCSECLVDRRESDFSGAQLKKKAKRVCKRCVARKQGELQPSPMETRPNAADVASALQSKAAAHPSGPSAGLSSNSAPTVVDLASLPPPIVGAAPYGSGPTAAQRAAAAAAAASATAAGDSASSNNDSSAVDSSSKVASLFASIMATAQSNLQQLQIEQQPQQ